MVKLEVLDSVWTRVNKEGYAALNNFLSYEHFYWRKTGYSSEKVIQRIWMIERHADGYCFLTGLVERAILFLEANKIKYELIDNQPEVELGPAGVEGYEFRDYQRKLIDRAVDHGRGQIISATGTGKSIVLLGIMSSFPKDGILFLVHTKDLVDQMEKDVIKAFPNEDIGVWSGKKKKIGRITIATIQSWVRVHEKHTDKFSVILIDEAHHVSGLDTMYAKVLMMSSAHTKIGVTATQSSNNKGKWSAEALLGPILGTYTIGDATEDNVLAKPTIHIYKNKYIKPTRNLPEYLDRYNFGIVDNVIRNIKIVEIALEFIRKKKTTLITVTSVEHGKNLEMIFKQYDEDIKFIYGKSNKEERDAIKNGLKTKETLCAVASVIFLEGIDIPTLDVVINAGGGVSPVQVVQRIGRALRKTKTKSKAILVDFIDEVVPTLERQSHKRIEIYKENNWKIVYKNR